METNDKYLEEVEMIQMQLDHAMQSIEQKQIGIEERDIVMLRMHKEIHKLRSELLDKSIEDKVRNKDNRRKALEEMKAQHRKLTKTIAEKYELDEKWGFNPDTGKII